MESDSEEDPWGEEPHWAVGESHINNNENKGGSLSEKDDAMAIIAAQHIFILIDCHPSMFVPSICVRIDQFDAKATTKKQTGEVDKKLVSPFDVALMSCEKLLRLRVHDVATSKTNGKRDGVGILLYGVTRNSRNFDREQEPESDEEEEEESLLSSTSLHELIPLVPSGTQQILQIRNCLPQGFDDENQNNLAKELRKRNLREEFVDEGIRNSSAISDSVDVSYLRSALHESIKSFSNAKCVKKNAAPARYPMMDTKSLWIFTNQDDPCQSNEREIKQTLVIANDVAENGIEIHLWPLGNAFRTSIFYDKIDVSPKCHAFGIPSSRNQRILEVDNGNAFHLGDVLEEVQNNCKKIRKLQSIPLLLPDWKSHPNHPGIMLDLYSLIKIKRKPNPVIVHQKTNRVTQRTTQILAIDTGEIIQNKDRLRTFVDFGGKRVYLSNNDLSKIKKGCNSNPNFASLILCGFKHYDDSTLPLQFILEKSLFAFPNEDLVSGSTKAFAAIHASMSRKKVYGIGELLTRVTGSSRMVAIIPQEGQMDANSNEKDDLNIFDSSSRMLHPPGFVIISLPFQEDIRSVPEDTGFVADDITVDAAVDLIKHQQLHGIEIGQSFENPSLCKFWHYIECVSLGIKLKDKVDETQMNVKTILESANSEIVTFRASLPTDNDYEEPLSWKKRRKF